MGGGGTTTKTVTQQSPPQLLPEAAQGYGQAQDFYKGILAQPPVYGGQRVADLSPLSAQGFGVASSGFQPGPVQGATNQQLYNTLTGNYLNGPAIQGAVASAAQPLFQQLQQQTLPEINTRSQLAGQGVTGTRAGVATDEALQQFGQALATGVVAPIVEQERQNQLEAVKQSAIPTEVTALESQGLFGAGQLEQAQRQQQLSAAQAVFEEPLFRASQAAEALFGASGLGGGSGLSKTDASSTPSTMAKVGEGIQMVGTVAAIAAMCWVAEAIYGPKALQVDILRKYFTTGWRRWIIAPIYRKIGRRTARLVNRYDWFKRALKPIFDYAVGRAIA